MNTSLLLAPEQNNFIVKIDSLLFTTPMTEKYNNVILERNMMYKNISDMIHATIQSITPPSFGLSNVEQTLYKSYINGDNSRYQGIFLDYRNIQDLKTTQEITITFAHVDAYVTYMYFLESFLFFKNPKNSNNGSFGDIHLYMYDSNRNIMFTMTFKLCLFSSLSEISFNYSDVTREYNTFDLAFNFDSFTIEFNTPHMVKSN